MITFSRGVTIIYNSARVKKIIQFLFSSCPYID